MSRKIKHPKLKLNFSSMEKIISMESSKHIENFFDENLEFIENEKIKLEVDDIKSIKSNRNVDIFKFLFIIIYYYIYKNKKRILFNYRRQHLFKIKIICLNTQ
jgi:hypothetical protein